MSKTAVLLFALAAPSAAAAQEFVLDPKILGATSYVHATSVKRTDKGETLSLYDGKNRRVGRINCEKAIFEQPIRPKDGIWAQFKLPYGPKHCGKITSELEIHFQEQGGSLNVEVALSNPNYEVVQITLKKMDAKKPADEDRAPAKRRNPFDAESKKPGKTSKGQ